jgi:hypothetical protein
MSKTREALYKQLQEDGAHDKDATHDADDIYNVLETVLTEYGNPTDEMDEQDADDDINETADSYTPVYNGELDDWLHGHPDALAEYNAQCGGLGELIEKEGLHRAIMASYCLTLQSDAYNAYLQLWNDTPDAEDEPEEDETAPADPKQPETTPNS